MVQRLTSAKNINFDIDKNVTLMVITTEHERQVDERTSYRACFSGINLTRTMIVIGIYLIQILNGNPIRGYSTYFLQQAGLPTTQAFNMTIVGFAVAIVGGFFSVRQYSKLRVLGIAQLLVSSINTPQSTAVLMLIKNCPN